MSETTSFDCNSIKALASIVQKVGIPLHSDSENGRNPRYEALAFIVRANDPPKTSELLQEISQLALTATNDIKQAACHISWRIHEEVSSLFCREIKKIELGQYAEEYKEGARAVHNLYLACKCQNSKKHEQGDIVNFAGVPLDILFCIHP